MPVLHIPLLHHPDRQVDHLVARGAVHAVVRAFDDDVTDSRKRGPGLSEEMRVFAEAPFGAREANCGNVTL